MPDKPGTPREKYNSLKLQLVEKGRWFPQKDLEIRSLLGLPAMDVEAVVPQVEVTAEPEIIESEFSMKSKMTDLNRRAKELGVKAGGKKQDLVEAIRRAEASPINTETVEASLEEVELGEEIEDDEPTDKTIDEEASEVETESEETSDEADLSTEDSGEVSPELGGSNEAETEEISKPEVTKEK